MQPHPQSGFEVSPNLFSDSASQTGTPANQNLQNPMGSREDWTLFRSLNTLPQKAGVALARIPRLVLKELVDNALDASGSASIREEGGTYIIEDDGPGIDGAPEDIARLFSISRALTSSKVWRMPSRGALGNGLRVASGAVLASSGTLAVITHNRRIDLQPQDDGTTAYSVSNANYPRGTRIEISFGPEMPRDGLAMLWAREAINAAYGETYRGKSSPFWYDADAFFELLQSMGDLPVRGLIERLDGCTGAKAGTIAADYLGMQCRDMDRDQAIALLSAARQHARPVNPKRLGAVGDALGQFYASTTGEFVHGARNPKAIIPFVVEASAEPCEDADGDITVLTNRTPITGSVRISRSKRQVTLWGCGLGHRFEAETGGFDITLNIIAPVIPITTDGKEPDLTVFVRSITDVIQAAVRKAKRAQPKTSFKRTQKAVILEHIEAAVAKASGDGEYEFIVRQLYYALRPYVISELGAQLNYQNFSTIITDYETEHGDIAGMLRDPRGTLYHPHTGQTIPIGTKAVDGYVRPAWTFNKVLFIEKEGFFESLKSVQWPERYDCALLTSKGFSTRAVRDLLDLLGESAEEDITVYCVHDADAYGTMIFQTLQGETRARARRKIEIVNLGLEPWEAQDMGLESELRDKDREAPVADYIRQRPDGAHWADWLQGERYELNAMTMPQFIGWLDRKMAEHGVEKVVPPAEVVAGQLAAGVEDNFRSALMSEFLGSPEFQSRLAGYVESVVLPAHDAIEEALPEWLGENPTDNWLGWVAAEADEIARAAA